jgi:RNA methyltransferase, TrmH family
MITSLSNEKIKQIRHLKDRKFRSESGLFFIEGLRLVIEACQQGANIDTLIVAPGLLSSEIGKALVSEERWASKILEVSAEVFESFSHKEGPQGIAAILKQDWVGLDDINIENGMWIALDSVSDPGNLGTILRTTEAAGGLGVILLDQATDPYDHTALRASMGAIFDLKITRCSLEDFRIWKRSKDIFMVGTDGEADCDYRQVLYPNPLIILMGSEREGLQPEHYTLCDQVVKIPMIGRGDSLNLAVATGIMIYQVFNQWHPARGDEK